MENQSSKLTKEQHTFLALIQNEIQFGIALALSLYKSMKLKQISKFIDRTDPTTLHHIKQMAEQDLLTLDDSKIVGKYYILSKWGRKIMDEVQLGGYTEDDVSVIPEKPLSEEDLNVQANVMRTIGLFSKNLINHSAHYAETVMVERLKLSEEERKQEGLNFRITIEDIKIKTVDQSERLQELFNDFMDGLQKLKEDSANSESDELDIDYLLFLEAIPVSVMHPEKIDEALKKKK